MKVRVLLVVVLLLAASSSASPAGSPPRPSSAPTSNPSAHDHPLHPRLHRRALSPPGPKTPWDAVPPKSAAPLSHPTGRPVAPGGRELGALLGGLRRSHRDHETRRTDNRSAGSPPERKDTTRQHGCGSNFSRPSGLRAAALSTGARWLVPIPLSEGHESSMSLMIWSRFRSDRRSHP